MATKGTYTVEEARRILNLDADFDADTIQEYIDSADAELSAGTGQDYISSPTALSKKFVRLTMLQEHYNPYGENKDYDFDTPRKSLLTRLSVMTAPAEEETTEETTEEETIL